MKRKAFISTAILKHLRFVIYQRVLARASLRSSLTNNAPCSGAAMSQ